MENPSGGHLCVRHDRNMVQTRTASILAFNTETRPTVTGPDNLLAPESKIARSVLSLLQSIPAW